MTATERLMGAAPAWQADPPPEVVIRHRSGSVSSRRPYPVAKNDPFVPRLIQRPGFDLDGVGTGNDVYLEPDEDAESGSPESKDRIKRIRNVGAGAQTLIEQQDGDLDNKLRTLKAAAGALLSVTQNLEENEVDSTGVTGGIAINIDGQIGATRGIIHTLLEGRRGSTGTLSITRCGGSPEQILAWENGQITSGTVVFDVGDCGSTDAPGP